MTRAHWLILATLISIGLWTALYFGVIIVALQFSHVMSAHGSAGAATMFLLSAGLVLVALGYALHCASMRWQWAFMFERPSWVAVVCGAVLLLAGSGASLAVGVL